MEVERIELSSLANYELTTTCLAFWNLISTDAERHTNANFLHLSRNCPLGAGGIQFHTKSITVASKTLGPVLDYRALKTVKS